MINLELLPLPVSRIAFVSLLYDKLRVASLRVSRIAFVSILYDKLRVAPPICLINQELLPLPVLELRL